MVQIINNNWRQQIKHTSEIEDVTRRNILAEFETWLQNITETFTDQKMHFRY